MQARKDKLLKLIPQIPKPVKKPDVIPPVVKPPIAQPITVPQEIPQTYPATEKKKSEDTSIKILVGFSAIVSALLI